MKLFTALLFCLISGEAFGQAAVQQYGTIIPYDIPRWSRDHMIEDAGGITGKNGRGVNPFGILDSNKNGVCSYTDLTTKPYNAVCLGHDSNGNGIISIESQGGLPPKDLFFVKDGVSYPITGGGGGNVNGPVPTTLNHIAVWNNTLGTLLKSTSDIGLTTLTINSPAGTATPLSISQQPSGTGTTADKYFNQIVINNDSWVNPRVNIFGFVVHQYCCTTTTQGWRFAVGGRIDVNTPWSVADPEPVFVGGLFNGRANAAASSSGAYLGGVNANVQMGSGTSGWNTIAGIESDVQIFTGATPPQVKWGTAIVLGALDTMHATGLDYGLAFTNAGTSGGWNQLINIDSMFGSSPISTVGSVIGMRGPATFAFGIDLRQATITSAVLAGPGGNLVLNGDGSAFFGGQVGGTANIGAIGPPTNPAIVWAITTNYSLGNEVSLWNNTTTGQGFSFRQKDVAIGQQELGAFLPTGATTSVGTTTLRIFVNNSTGQHPQQVSLGAPDSAGTGYRTLRVNN